MTPSSSTTITRACTMFAVCTWTCAAGARWAEPDVLSPELETQVGGILGAVFSPDASVCGSVDPQAVTVSGPDWAPTLYWSVTGRRTGHPLGGCNVTTGCGRVRTLTVVTRPPEPTAPPYVSPDAARAVAVPYAHSVALSALGVREISLGKPTTSGVPDRETDNYRFAWSLPLPDGARQGALRVEVNAFTGEVTRIRIDISESYGTEQKERDKRQRTLARLQTMMGQKGLPPVADADIIHESLNWHVAEEGPEFYWSVAFEVPSIASARPGCVRVGTFAAYARRLAEAELEFTDVPTAWTATARECGIPIEEARLLLAPEPDPTASDAGPRVMAGGSTLAIQTSRRFSDYPPWRHPDEYIAVAGSGQEGGVAALRYTSCRAVAASRSGHWLAYANRDRLVLLNVRSGEEWVRLADHPPRPDRLAVASQHPWAYGRVTLEKGTVLWGRFYPDPKQTGNLAVETVPALNEQDVALAFDERDSRLAILSVASDVGDSALRLEVAPVTDEAVVGARELLVSIDASSRDVRRPPSDGAPSSPAVSWSPAGDAILVDVAGALVCYDLVAGAWRPVLDLGLMSPDGDGALLPCMDSIRFLTSDTLVFSARGEDWPPERGARIYSCKLDGSEVKRLTPLDDDPIPRWIFPETGEPAFKMPWE